MRLRHNSSTVHSSTIMPPESSDTEDVASYLMSRSSVDVMQNSIRENVETRLGKRMELHSTWECNDEGCISDEELHVPVKKQCIVQKSMLQNATHSGEGGSQNHKVDDGGGHNPHKRAAKRKASDSVSYCPEEGPCAPEEGYVSVKRRCYMIDELSPEGLFKDDLSPVGGKVKQAGAVLSTLAVKSIRQPNVNCRVEALGRICESFDDMRKGWVRGMGFGGLLHLIGMRLPRMLCYWLMTRVDPTNEMFRACDKNTYRLSRNQVRWVLGLPIGPSRVPRRAVDQKMRAAISEIETKYGQQWKFTRKATGRVVSQKGISITSKMVERLEGTWEEHEEAEFKTLFLLVALHLVLCPTQGPHLAPDLIPGITCAMECKSYDWCELVLSKLMDSVRSFARRFYAEGYAGGCGGCTIFLAVFYLDRLNRNPMQWGTFPRIKVWSYEQIRKVSNADRSGHDRDYGCTGCVDVAYGESHPRDARDTEGPCSPD